MYNKYHRSQLNTYKLNSNRGGYLHKRSQSYVQVELTDQMQGKYTGMQIQDKGTSTMFHPVERVPLIFTYKTVEFRSSKTMGAL